MINQQTIDRVAAAIDSADIGFRMKQIRLVDDVNTYALIIDGMPTEEFTDNDSGSATDQLYARLREVKQQRQAEAVIEALTASAFSLLNVDALKAAYVEGFWIGRTTDSRESGEDQWPRSKTHADWLAESNTAPATDATGAALVAKIAHVASAIGFQANVPALDVAGQMLSCLAANPEHIERFMVEGTDLFLDGTFDYANGSLTFRAMNGAIVSPSILREMKGTQQ